MCSKILKNVLQHCKRGFNINNTVIFYRNISKTRVFTPERTPRRMPLHITIKSEQEDLLSTALKSGKVLTKQDWISLKESVLTRGKFINEVNFDAKAIGCCIAYKNIDAAKTLVKYYESVNQNLNIGALGKFMKLLYVCSEDKNILTPDIEDLILTTYKQIKQSYPVIPIISAENVIPALSLTMKWKECLDLLEIIKGSMRPSIGTYSVIIKAAFQNDDLDLGWELINEMSSYNKFPPPSVYSLWLQKVKKFNKDILKSIEILFQHFADNEISPTRDVTDLILEILKPFSYIGSYTSINKNGTCKCCQEKLEEIKINDIEFNELKSQFMDNVIIGKNVFAKTNPEELQRFKTFISSETYDMVIDGLNVAYSAGNKQRPDVYGRLLSNVVRHYRQRNKNILILGRQHMNKWPKNYLGYIRSNSKMFLAQNISQDDPFLLYATMSSGLGTCFLSRDFMRGHLYLLMQSNLKRLFKRWQQLHQHSLIYVEHNGQVHIKTPYPYLCTAQESTNGWHIPFVENYLPMTPISFEPPKNWLCIRKKIK